MRVSCVLQSELQSLIVQCQRRLDYVIKSGAKRGLKQPTVDEVTQSLVRVPACMAGSLVLAVTTVLSLNLRRLRIHF